MHKISRSLTIVVAILIGASGRADQKSDQTRQEKEAALVEIIEKHFDHWDRNHDGILDLDEIDREVENHAVRGRQAAIVFCIRRRLVKKDKESGDKKLRLSRDELLKLAKDRAFQKSFDATVKKLATIDRELFLPTDPDLSTFHQGRLGDCYLLATIAAEAHRNPKALREMIRPVVTGGFEVDFADGQKIKVGRLTDCELLVGAKLDSKHGSWLAVLEKAYGIIRRHNREKKKKTDKSAKPSEVVPTANLGGGSSLPIIALMTGHQAEPMVLRKTANSEEVHRLLVELTKKRRLMCVSENVEKGKLPPGIINDHVYGLFAYDSKLRRCTLFNPWGNTFTPKGSPGLVNGYTTEHGVFTIPLDEFRQVFTALNYETGKPFAK